MFNNKKIVKMKTKTSQMPKNQGVKIEKIFPLKDQIDKISEKKHEIVEELKKIVQDWKENRELYFMGIISNKEFDQDSRLKKYQKLQRSFLKLDVQQDLKFKVIRQTLETFGLKLDVKIWCHNKDICSKYLVVKELEEIGFVFNNDLTIVFDPNFKEFRFNREKRRKTEEIRNKKKTNVKLELK